MVASEKEEGARTAPAAFAHSTPPQSTEKSQTRSSSPDSPVVLANQVDLGLVGAGRRFPTDDLTARQLTFEAEEPLLQDNDERFCLLPVK